jgi:hypothetical protein
VWALLHVKYGRVFFTIKILEQTKEKKLDLERVGPYQKKKKKKVHAFHVMSIRLDDHKIIIKIENT